MPPLDIGACESILSKTKTKKDFEEQLRTEHSKLLFSLRQLKLILETLNFVTVSLCMKNILSIVRNCQEFIWIK